MGVAAFDGWWRQVAGPVVAVVAEGDDELFARDDLHGRAQIVGEPILSGYGTGVGAALVLVVVHEDETVAVGG